MDDLKARLGALQKYGYAPGSDWCYCGECGSQHTADKRSLRCLQCAEKCSGDLITRAEANAMVREALEEVAKLAETHIPSIPHDGPVDNIQEAAYLTAGHMHADIRALIAKYGET